MNMMKNLIYRLFAAVDDDEVNDEVDDVNAQHLTKLMT